METDVITNIPSSSLTNNSDNTGISTMWKYIIIFLVLALLGFNLFTYFGELSNFIGNIINSILNLFRPILAYFGYGVGEVAKKTIDVTAGALTGGIDVTAGALTGGINVLERGLQKKKVKKLLKIYQNNLYQMKLEVLLKQIKVHGKLVFAI